MKKIGIIVGAVAALVVLVAVKQGTQPASDELSGNADSKECSSCTACSVVDSEAMVTASDGGQHEESAVKSDMEKPVRSEPVERPLASRETVPEHLHYLFGWGEEPGGYQRRSRRVEQMARDLSEAEVNALLAFLYMKPGEVGLSEGDFNATGDVVMEKIEDQMVIHPDYTEHLAAIYYDGSFSEIWRDYSLQHIGSSYKRMEASRLSVLRELYEDALTPGSVMAGTALLAMKNSLGGEGITPEYVSSSAIAVAEDASFRDSSRLTAMLIASELGSPDALTLAREVVESKEVTAHFKAAAIASIGLQGDLGDLDLLQKYSKSSDIRYRMAATSALEKLNERISN